MSTGTMRFAVLMGTGEPHTRVDAGASRYQEVDAMTFPYRSSSGPPELPGLIGVSVWMTWGMLNGPTPQESAPQRAHDSPVMLNSCPKGLPTAKAS